MNKEELKFLIAKYEKVQFAVHKKAGMLTRELIKEEAGLDLTMEQHAVLRFINQTEHCTSSHLADFFMVNKSAITAIITRLADRGFISRVRDRVDRRVVYLTLTDEGSRLYNQCEEKVQELVGSFITQFEKTEIEQFLQTYEKLENLLDQKINEAGDNFEIHP